MVYKTLKALVKDLENHTFLLKLAVNNFGNHSAFYSLIATQLRTIVCSGKGQIDLLFFLADKLEIELTVRNDKEKISLKEYLFREDIFFGETKFNKFKFIKEMANVSGEFLHVKTELDNKHILSKYLFLNNQNSNHFQLKSIAEIVLEVLEFQFFPKYKSISDEKYDELNKKYLNEIGVSGKISSDGFYVLTEDNELNSKKFSFDEGSVYFWCNLTYSEEKDNYSFYKYVDRENFISLDILNKKDLVLKYRYNNINKILKTDYSKFFNKDTLVSINWSIKSNKISIYLDKEINKEEEIK